MIVKVSSKRQVTFPKEVVRKLGIQQGDTLQIIETADGFLLRPHRFLPDKLAPLKDKIDRNLPAPNLEDVRHAITSDPGLRD